MRSLGLSNVEEPKGFERVKPGGYICQITAVKDVPMDQSGKGDYLLIEYDIADGEFKGYYKNLYDSKGFWGASFMKSYKEKALPFFKAFITALRESNNGFIWHDDGANDENVLRGKYIGLVLAEEEYKGNDGSIKTRLYVDSVRSVNSIKNGDFEVPALKKMAVTESWGDIPSADDSSTLPWG